MGKVACFQLDGLVCTFYSNDHPPPHFHAKRRGEWECRVFFLLPSDQMLEPEWGTIRTKDARLIRHRAEEHRVELLDEWAQKVQPDG